jgi:hypothetical protein
VTSSATGAPLKPGEPWKYQVGSPQIGGDLRYGLTPNLTLHATAHPDFSQVESDVTQFSFDPRQAVSYPEKRPFFLDGVEQFDAPSNLIYTRRIVQPVFAGKMTGKVGDNQIGVLAAVDDRTASQYGDNPVFAIVRASHDLGPGSRIGGVWTEQHDGSETNRVVGVDSRVVFDTINSVTITGAFAHDDAGDAVNGAPLWGVGYRRDGRHFRMNYSVSGVADSFVTRSGFLSQTGIAEVLLDHSYTWLWHQRTLESLAAEVLLKGHYRYDDFIRGGPIQNRNLYLNLNARFRGGWTAGLGWYPESFGYDSTIYVNYGLLHPDGTVTPFTGGNARLHNDDYVVTGSTPTWKTFDLNFLALAGPDENYSEWATGNIGVVIAGMDIRPTDHLRFNVTYNDSRVYRPSDGSRVLLQDVAVGTTEYQLSRAFQLRLIAQYAVNTRDSLHDDSRTDLPIVIRDPATGAFVRAAAYDNRQLQLNFLFTYLPNPGTVVYFGYGTVDQRPDLTGRPILAPAQSSFFVKFSYLFRSKG